MIDRRYAIEGGGDFAKNAREFSDRFPSTDGIVLTNWITRETQALFDNYVHTLEQFAETCRENGKGANPGLHALALHHPSCGQLHRPNASRLGSIAAVFAKSGT